MKELRQFTIIVKNVGFLSGCIAKSQRYSYSLTEKTSEAGNLFSPAQTFITEPVIYEEI